MIKMSYQKNIRLRSDPRLDAKWAHSVDIGKHIYLFLYIKVHISHWSDTDAGNMFTREGLSKLWNEMAMDGELIGNHTSFTLSGTG